ncbi:DUF4389 domain-containing protein [Arthrobacter sp. TMN-49]
MTSNPAVGSKNPRSSSGRPGVAGAIVALVLGTFLAMLGVGGIFGGVASAVVTSLQGADGYFNSPTRGFSTSSHALTSPPAQIGVNTIPFDLGTIRINAAATTPGGQVFIGIGPRAEVEHYLQGVHTTEITGIRSSPFRVSYSDVPGSAVPTPPAAQRFWAVQSSGAGAQQVTMDVRSGNWVVVIMNADATAGVNVAMRAGFHSDLFGTLTAALLIGGLVFLIFGVGLTVIGAVGLGRNVPSSSQRPPDATGPDEHAHGLGKVDGGSPAGVVERGRYPARLSGQMDAHLSRWLWLVKWLLAVPHVFILFFLWFAVFFTTIIAGFAILFTGRYPRALFNFAVGVLRWNWRVTFYAYSALATDKYPPFTLASTDYPADFEVDYPEHLSHGLVLVKGWLLALPHLLIVAIFTGAAWQAWSYSADGSMDYGHGTRFSLLGILVLIVAIMLLFTGRYQHTLFDLIMGINRWVYRVGTYVFLLRDEYPPFRLDQGPDESGYSPQGHGR